jgi:hypothetical protein
MFKRFLFKVYISSVFAALLTGNFLPAFAFDPSSTPFSESSSGSENQIESTYRDNSDPSMSGNGNGVRNGLPPTTLDSFVYEAGGKAELIYGDEGVDGAPPYSEFDQTHRINAGITGRTAIGLTTGHGSLLPNGVGGDEFVKTEAWTQSGSTSSEGSYNGGSSNGGFQMNFSLANSGNIGGMIDIGSAGSQNNSSSSMGSGF